jgi:energy-coupling factor transport system ATP-binding protein
MGIQVKNLDYVYMKDSPFEKKALDGVNLEIRDGEFAALLGHTGSGKSTLIQHFNALLFPMGGEVLIDGVSTTKKGAGLKALRAKAGLVFQYPEHQLFEETVYKDIAFGPKNMGLSDGEIEPRVLEAARYTGLDESLLQKSPFELSGGQKRRAAIAGVLAMRPKILILDEPTAGLDPAGREEILTQLRALHSKGGMTVVLVTHSMEDAAKTAGRILVMRAGKIVMDGKPKEIFSQGERLREMGLNAPQITLLADELARRGLDVGQGIYTVEQLKNRLLLKLGLLQRKEPKC